MTRDVVSKNTYKLRLTAKESSSVSSGNALFSEIMMPNRNILKHGSNVLFRQGRGRKDVKR